MTEHNHWLLPEGIDETLPPKAQALERLRRNLLDLHHSWGYELIFPPFVEYLESLLTGSGGDLDLQTFKLTDQVTGRTLGIRADITPQAARIDAHQLRRDCPTRLCYLGTVLNSRSDGFGGSRSPLQIGAELYGHSGIEADLEVLCLMLESLERAGSLVRDCRVQGAVGEMMVSLAELSGAHALERAGTLLSGASDEVHSALGELDDLSALLLKYRPALQVHCDLAELRGYHYHTGVMFAAFVPGMGQEVARGGRYDDIGKLFGRARPACGFSADLNLMLRLGGEVEPEQEAGIFAPWSDDGSITAQVEALRRQGRRVIAGLPGQTADAVEMGCSEKLVKQGNRWVVTAV